MKNIDFIVCAYAIGKKYWDFADRLEYGLDKLDVPYDIERWKKKTPVDNFRNIQLYKPTFVHNKMKKHKKPIMYVDVDTIFTGKPKIPNLPFDIGVVLRLNRNGRKFRYGLRCWNFCTLWNWSHNSYYILNEWKRYCADDEIFKNRRDHKRLNVAQKRNFNLYNEFVLNGYIKNDILGYIERGSQKKIITEPEIPPNNKRIMKLLKKEKQLYGRRY